MSAARKKGKVSHHPLLRAAPDRGKRTPPASAVFTGLWLEGERREAAIQCRRRFCRFAGREGKGINGTRRRLFLRRSRGGSHAHYPGPRVPKEERKRATVGLQPSSRGKKKKGGGKRWLLYRSPSRGGRKKTNAQSTTTQKEGKDDGTSRLKLTGQARKKEVDRASPPM